MKVFAALVGVGIYFSYHGYAQSHDLALSPRTNYLERCGGCHGITGRSASMLVPDLKDRAGYFLCNRRSRSYVARLPNVVFSQISDTDLAALLNYVMFGLGADSVRADAAKYTASELKQFRKDPVTTTDMVAYRRKIVASLIKDCGAPAALLTDYHPSTRLP